MIKLLPLITLIASIFIVFYFHNPSEEECSLFPFQQYWITSKRIVTPQGVISGAVEINEGKIISVVKEEDRHGKISGVPIIDYGDAVVMPGLVDIVQDCDHAAGDLFWLAIDSNIKSDDYLIGVGSMDGIALGLYISCLHVHLDDPGRSEWEGFPSGTKAAAAGGVTTLVDMPLNNFPSTVSEETLKLKIKAAEGRIYVDVGFWGGLVPENAFNASVLDSLLSAGALGLKSFMCPSGIDDFPMTNITHIKEGLSVLAKYKRPLLVHSEIELDPPSHLHLEDSQDDPRAYSTYLATRPPSWEEAAVRELLTVTNNTRVGGPAEGAHLHIVHLSDSGSTLELIKKAKSSGDSVSVETCTHYLAFSKEEIKDGDTRFKCAPPIRDKANKEKLWEALLEGHIDMLSSDHSPSLPELKQLDSGDFLRAWGGISSLQFDLSATWAHAKKRGVTLEQLALWWSERPAKLAGLELKGGIVIGKDADIVAWEPDEEFEVNDTLPIYLKHPGNSAYMEKKLSGKVLATFVRGNVVYKEKHAQAACGTPILASVINEVSDI